MVQILEETAPPRGRNEYNLIGNRSFILKKQFRLKFRYWKLSLADLVRLFIVKCF